MNESVRELSMRYARYDRNLKADLVKARRQRNLTQKDVAKLLGVPTRWVKKIERYDSDPRMSELRRYRCAIFSTPLPEGWD